MLGHLPELLGRSVLRDSIWVHGNFKERTWQHFQELRGFVPLPPLAQGRVAPRLQGPRLMSQGLSKGRDLTNPSQQSHELVLGSPYTTAFTQPP